MAIRGEALTLAVFDAQADDLRAAARYLRGLAVDAAALLAPVAALDNPDTWLSPWQARCSARIVHWRRVLARCAAAMEWRAGEYEAAAGRLAEPAATTGPRPGASPPGRSPAAFLGWAGVAAEIRAGDPDEGDAGGRQTVAFSPERLGALATSLTGAADAAGGAVRAVERVEARAARTGAVLPAMAPVAVPGIPVRSDAMRAGLHLVLAGAPAMAAGIARRMRHFAAAEAAVRTGGVLIDPAAWFDDAAPVDLTRVRTTADDLIRIIGADPAEIGIGDARAVDERLGRLSPAERQAVIGRLRGRPLAVLGRALAHSIVHVQLRTLRDIPVLVRMTDTLLAGAPSELVDEIVRTFPHLEPAVHGTQAERLGETGPLATTDRAADRLIRAGVEPDDVGQGLVGDCYFAAALVGVARQNPGIIRDNIRENPNGTVTVTFYRDGRAQPVTVTKVLPFASGPGIELGMDAENAAGQREVWPALYEKAYARARGSYAGIERGDPGAAATLIVGRAATRALAGRTPIRRVRDRLAAGDVVAVTTRSRTRPGVGLVPSHAYTVVDVDEVGGRVLLRNPWDATGDELRGRWYSWAAIQRDLSGIRLCPTR